MERTKGFSLIEVLVALLLTTVGILGMVALQGQSIRYTQDAINRNNAASLTNDLIEIMRQYPEEFWVGEFDALENTTALFNANGVLQPQATACPSDAYPQNLAGHLGCWVQQMESILPGGGTDDVRARVRICPSFTLSKGEIACANSAFEGSSMGIQLAWQVNNGGECMDGDDDNTVCIYQTRFEL